MIKPLKQKRCHHCREMFTPKRNGIVTTKICGSPACVLDAAQNVPIRKIVKPKPKNKAPKTVAELKKQLWPIFSLHQKLVHSSDGKYCQCYTCDSTIEIGTSDCQGGHNFSKAACPNIYWDERCVRPQCNKCNSYYGGMHYEFNERLKQEIGMSAWQDMYDNRKLVVKRDRHWFIEKIAYYNSQVKELRSIKS